MGKERLYQAVIALLLGVIIVMGLIMAIKIPRRKPVAAKTAAKIARPARMPAKTRGKIAVVIDDIGYSASNLPILDGVAAPLTFSVLPGLSYSESAALDLAARGFEIILHLPMEPLEKTDLEQDTVLTTMSDDQIRSAVAQHLARIPGVRGASNHMGSRATEDPRTMELVLESFKKKRLYFLDSFVTPRSVAQDVAQKLNVKFIKRDVFLDNTLDPAYIRRQFDLLKQKAERNGAAVGIGHDRKVTLEVLKELIPETEREGFKFIFASELAR